MQERDRHFARHADSAIQPSVEPAHYGRREGEYEPHATTLDYLVAAAAG